MRNLNILILTSLVSVNLFAANPQKLTIIEVAKKVKENNYLVLENAARVYQAKENIGVARGNLLPSLNIWKIAKLVAGIASPASLIEMVPDIAPFLVPNNWLRLEQADILYEAQAHGYNSLWANEVWNAKSLYLKILMDQELLSVVSQNAKDLLDLVQVAKAKEQIGAIRPGTSQGIEIQYLSYKEDARQLTLLVNTELSLLAFSVGLPVDSNIQTDKIALPDLAREQPLNYYSFVNDAVKKSPEVQQYAAFLKVLPLIKREQYFSFLGASSISRGVAGGVFNDLPLSEGLGFGTGPSIRIVKSEIYIFEIRKLGVEETIRKQLLNSVDTINSGLTGYGDLNKRLLLAKEQIELLKTRLFLGQNVDLEEIVLAMHMRGVSQALLTELRFQYVTMKDKVNRLLLDGDYQKN